MDLIGKQLPSVSAADNGKVLGVENGHWRPIMPTPTSPADMVYIPYQSLTYSSITDALAAGQTPFTKHTVSGEDYTFYLMRSDTTGKYIFTCVTQDLNSANVFQMHFLQVTSGNIKVTATELFYNRNVIDNLRDDVDELSVKIQIHQIPISVSGSVATLDFTDKFGIENVLRAYSAGLNIQIVAKNYPNPNNILIFSFCGVNPDPDNLYVDLSCISDGRAYYVRLTPVDTNVMRGTLVETAIGT